MTDIVLWNAKEAKAHCEEFVRDYAKFRSALLDHYQHKGHVALRYSDDWRGFFAYCRERLKLDSNEQTIRLQVSTAQVSREVGVEVPMVISRQLAKLPPEQQKGVYDEVIGAREKAGQRSANQMEPDVRRVVRRVMGIVEPEPPPVSTTDTVEEFTEGERAFADAVMEAEEPSGDLDATNFPATLTPAEMVLCAARDILVDWVAAYAASDYDGQLAAYMTARAFLAAN